jgi:hypothetical protein
MGNRIYFKIAGYVDLDMLHIFAIKLNIYLYSFWNIRRTVLQFYKFDEKRAITPRWVIRFTQLYFQGRIREGAHLVLNYAQIKITHSNQERIQDFKLGGGALKKNCAERREAQNFLGYFVWKIMILSQKIIFFSKMTSQ